MCWWVNLRERDHLEDSGVDWRIILIWIFRKWDREEIGTGLIWLEMGIGGEKLFTW
jgi:hypothetical protein